MVARVDVHIDDALLDLYWRDPFGDLAREIERRGAHVHLAIQRQTPRHTGRLAASVRKTSVRFAQNTHDQVSMEVVVGSPALTPYLGFILDGTPPHEIRPRGFHYAQADEGPSYAGRKLKRRRVQNSALRFTVNGEVRFATVVHHPGTSANDFITRGLIEGFAQ